MPHSTRSPVDSRPAKPRPDFPLFAHRSGQWCKKIRGRACYFGSWRSDPTGQQALVVYEAEAPYLERGEDPPANAAGVAITLQQLVNLFLEAKEEKVDAGELAPLTFEGYFPPIERLLNHFGKQRQVETITPKEWGSYRLKLADLLAPTSASVEVAKIRAILNWGKKSQLHKEIEVGPDFCRTPASVVRKYKQAGGKRVFTREEVRRILDASDPLFRAIVTLAVNTGFGNADVASLCEDDLDLDGGWVEFARVKTAIERRCPLWPETVQAIRAWMRTRPKPASKELRGRVFLSEAGTALVRIQPKQNPGRHKLSKTSPVDLINQRFRGLLKRLKINGRRGLNFYGLRHCFETHGGESKDQVAVDSIMGHVDGTMAANYRHGVSDERLVAVVKCVRLWLWPPEDAAGKEGGAS
jgi:integrase